MLAAFVNALALLLLVGFIVVEAVARIARPEPVAGTTVLVIAAVGLAINLGTAWMLSHAPTSTSAHSALLHVLSDALGSVAALVAGAVIIGTEFTPLGAEYQQANPDLSNDDLLFDAAGVPERIWKEASIGRCSALLSSTYFLWIPFLVVCLLATAQATPTTILAPVRWDAPPSETPLATPMRYDVFVSYRHDGADSHFATELVAALEADGYRVAIDARDFAANASFLQEMERSIRESRFTVAIISRRYLDSGHTEEEAVIAKVLDMGDRKRRLIPMLIEPVTMPAWLYGIVGIDCTKRDPLVDPFDKLKATLGAPLASAMDAR